MINGTNCNISYLQPIVASKYFSPVPSQIYYNLDEI